MIKSPRIFTFDGQTSFDNGIIVTRIQRPILPTLRDRKLVIAGKDGAWDFGNNTYEESEITIECILIQPLDKRALMRSIAQWLSAKGNLIFSDEADKYYYGRLYSTFTEEIDGVIGSFSLTFVVDPFAYSIVSTAEEIFLDSELPLDASITLDNSVNYQFVITGNETVTIINFGTRPIRPVFTISGSFSNITLQLGSQSLSYNSPISSQTLVIDCESYEVELDGVNTISELSGDFITLGQGDNEVTISGTGMNFNLEIDFLPVFY